MSALILIVEDERDLLTTLEYSLQREGYQTRSAATAQDALELVQKEPLPNLVLLDLMLPDMSGTEVCKRMKNGAKTKDIPVVMVTARAEEIDRVVGFEVGADDYVVKPYSMRELMLRVSVILKRSKGAESQSEDIEFGCLKLDRPGHRVWVEDQEIRLTALEFRLLTTFYDRRGRVQTRERLLTDVWGYQAEVTTRTVDTHMKRLREKLKAAGVYIETVRGVGYRMQARPNQSQE
ncbi:MAG: DNA-binding response regulator [Myxococcales bacterium]|nr:DNA-binding response regulator [Myxococcales bacterium]|tara:strand:- start:226 stop:930 length:705 start_codon:yes stop_codon:yes gene_type:complete